MTIKQNNGSLLLLCCSIIMFRRLQTVQSYVWNLLHSNRLLSNTAEASAQAQYEDVVPSHCSVPRARMARWDTKRGASTACFVRRPGTLAV